MRILKITDFIRGWIIGNFEPSIIKTDLFEVGILRHKKGEYWQAHYHEKCIEYNILVSGKMKIQDKIINKGDIFILDKMEIADPIFLKDCVVIVIKIPSIPNDKILV